MDGWKMDGKDNEWMDLAFSRSYLVLFIKLRVEIDLFDIFAYFFFLFARQRALLVLFLILSSHPAKALPMVHRSTTANALISPKTHSLALTHTRANKPQLAQQIHIHPWCLRGQPGATLRVENREKVMERRKEKTSKVTLLLLQRAPIFDWSWFKCCYCGY